MMTIKNPLEIRNCSQCGARVEIYHRKRTLMEHVFCSRKCDSEFKKAKPNTECINCGKPLHIKKSHLDKMGKFGPCCSRKCSGEIKTKMYVSENNPNHTYNKNLDMIYNLTNDGAYILGLIWSDGSLVKNTISITQKGWEECPLRKISEMIFGENVVQEHQNKDVLIINDKTLVDYLVSLGGIKRGKKSDVIEMPNIPKDKIWPFICGYFDGDGGFKYNYKYPEISITSNSKKMLKQISEYWNVNYTGKGVIYSSGAKALEICGKMYESCNLHNTRKYNYYLDILNWEPCIENGGRWKFSDNAKYRRLSKDAIPPQKTRVTDSGFDVHAVEFKPINEDLGSYFADTKIAVEPPSGYYFELIGRSSLPLNNLQFIGGIGVIDKTYVGSIKMIVRKLDPSLPLPETPFKCGQLVLREFAHCEFVTVDELSDTDRGDSGFGSTGKN